MIIAFESKKDDIEIGQELACEEFSITAAGLL
jgi:hypothetical protein